jgi:hypothetical protein
MDDIVIHMTKDIDKSGSLKGTDVYRSNNPNAVITNIYIKKSAGAPDDIQLTVGEKR